MATVIQAVSPEVTMTDVDEDPNWYTQHNVFPGEGEEYDSDLLYDAEINSLRDDVFSPMDVDGGSEGHGASNEGILSNGILVPAGYKHDKPEQERPDHPTERLVEGEDPDNPPFEGTDLDRTTVGVELEFLVAIAPEKETLDQHPADRRGLLQGMDDIAFEDPRLQVTVRNAIIDALRASNLVAAKGESSNIYLGATAEFGWASRLDQDPNGNNNLAYLRAYWKFRHPWNGFIDERENQVEASNQLLKQFIQFHESNGLVFRRTTQQVIEAVGGSLDLFTIGFPPGALPGLQRLWVERARQEIEQRWRQEDQREANVVDPNAILLPGMDPKYRAWTCTRDASFSADTANLDHYSIKGYAPPFGSDFPAPPTEYKWFSGEVVSPILDFDHEDTPLAIIRACNILRSRFRIHKPLSVIGTGFHVHFGQERGWTLLHLKKFTTAWLLLEESIEKLHRIDRSQDNFFSQSLRENSNLAKNIIAPSTGPAARSTLRNRDPDKADWYDTRALQHVDFSLPQISDFMRDLIRELWQYETVDDLNHGMTVQRGYGHIRYRLSGVSRAFRPTRGMYGTGILQTLEFRIMQGTLDADHMWLWMSICRQLILFSRDLDDGQFRDSLTAMLTAAVPPVDVLRLQGRVVNYFLVRLSQITGYFEYPDKDKIDWNSPFMLPGYTNMHYKWK
ncbi:hypothetical protein GGR53DRAFT_327373 [Hypoxylon sp. FL1150]|nr:hypothetical protein GGR53DRAFT_327373 [Hypoxylon sp. FL1150]